MRSFRQSTSPVEAFADDYAFVISGLLVSGPPPTSHAARVCLLLPAAAARSLVRASLRNWGLRCAGWP